MTFENESHDPTLPAQLLRLSWDGTSSDEDEPPTISELVCLWAAVIFSGDCVVEELARAGGRASGGD